MKVSFPDNYDQVVLSLSLSHFIAITEIILIKIEQRLFLCIYDVMIFFRYIQYKKKTNV